MRCPKCGAEERSRLLSSPCPNKACNYIWVDSEDYCNILFDPVPDIKTVLDIGCGLKGMIGQFYWEHVRHIQRGFACDIHVLKEMPPPWTPLLMDAEGLVHTLGAKSIDAVVTCGLIEHIPYAKALRVLHVIEQVAIKKVFITASAVCREVSGKAERDGNPFHHYRSFWDADVFEALGYTVDRKRMVDRTTFLEEVTLWYEPAKLGPWKPREARAIQLLTDRRCTIDGCGYEPVWWDPRANDAKGGSFCFIHAEERNKNHGQDDSGPIKRWYDDPRKIKDFPIPPWRDPLPLLPADRMGK